MCRHLHVNLCQSDIFGHFWRVGRMLSQGFIEKDIYNLKKNEKRAVT